MICVYVLIKLRFFIFRMAAQIDHIEIYEKNIQKCKRDLVFLKMELTNASNEEQRKVIQKQISKTTKSYLKNQRLVTEALTKANVKLDETLKLLEKRDEKMKVVDCREN